MNTKDQLLQIITDSLRTADNITIGLREMHNTPYLSLIEDHSAKIKTLSTIVANQNVLLKQLSEVCLVYITSGNYENDKEIHDLKIAPKL